jgi:hypothetical protein
VCVRTENRVFASVRTAPVVHTKAMNSPTDLGEPGRLFWESIVSVYSFADEPASERLLVECARIVDRLDALDAAVRRDGAMLATGRLNPALVESRQQQLVLGRLVNALDLRSADESAGAATVSDAARDIASARWAKQGRRA